MFVAGWRHALRSEWPFIIIIIIITSLHTRLGSLSDHPGSPLCGPGPGPDCITHYYYYY